LDCDADRRKALKIVDLIDATMQSPFEGIDRFGLSVSLLKRGESSLTIDKKQTERHRLRFRLQFPSPTPI
jgi:hypothetical protein